MEIRIGFVANALAVYANTPSSSYTYKQFARQDHRDAAMERAVEVGRSNLRATQRILYYCAAHGIRLYRMSSALVPLATHPDVRIDVGEVYTKELGELGAFARREDIRVTMHPNQFTLLNGSDKVVAAAIEDLEYHNAILDGMGMDASCIINIHVGGMYGDKGAAIQRLYGKLPEVPERVMRRLTFENDDKTYTAEETLAVCETAGRPMMLDLHHDWCNPSGAKPLELLPRIAATWGELPLKLHISSPKSEADFRSHADDVEPGLLLDFLRGCKEAGLGRVDVMVEAKRKDLACLKLAEELGRVRGVKRIDGAVLRW
ncbi:UV DNA damage repair endonuclease UvsE [Paenibacillus chartarius]|uniref:UV DNA damage repair endonuclease UvsE n=1 Tax=Paenibacillus chartarius TaxID=747481 RepID=A0ABV6DGK4_9BACL